MNSKNNPAEPPELLFLRLYKDYLYYFNMLERNMAYCMAHQNGQEGYAAGMEAILKIPFGGKIKKLKKLISNNPDDLEFTQWFDRVNRCRLMRNKLVHGHWELGNGSASPFATPPRHPKTNLEATRSKASVRNCPGSKRPPINSHPLEKALKSKSDRTLIYPALSPPPC